MVINHVLKSAFFLITKKLSFMIIKKRKFFVGKVKITNFEKRCYGDGNNIK